MSGAVVALLWVEAGSAFWLSFVLQLLYRRVLREQFLSLWSLSFAVMGIALAAQLAVVPPSAPQLYTSFLLYLLGTPQMPLVVLAALSLRSPAPSRRRQLAILAGAIAGLIVLSMVTAWAISDRRAMAEAQRVERLVVNSGAAVFFCVEFWRRHRLARTCGGKVTVLFTALRALHYAALIATIVGIPLYPGPHSIASSAMSTILPFGIAAGMMIVAAQAMTHTARRLQESEERYRTLVEASPNGIIATDSSGTIKMCNQRAAEMLGYASTVELIGTPSGDLIAAPDRQNARLPEEQAAGSPVHRASQVALRDGSVRAIELTTAILEGADEDIVGVTIMQDITERRQSEEAREQLESQLRQFQKMESIGRLAGGVAHDFNNHLTVIKGYCQLVLSRLDAGDPNRRPLENVFEAGDRAAKLTRQLLAFGRKQVLAPKPVCLNDIVSGMEAMLRRLVRESIGMTTKLDPDLGTTMADSGQIEQVLMNLVVNARDAVPNGGEIIIETANVRIDSVPAERRQEVRPGSYVMLAVADTGVGMDEQTRALIFEPFFTTKEAGQGTGLGLATVYGIVKQSGGSILVYSEPGIGTTFKVYLPRIDIEAQLARTPSESGAWQAGQGTILLVEDQEGVRHFVLEVLQSCGYDVIVAASGPEALTLADSDLRNVDLLITDVVMPQMSGKALAAALSKRIEGLPVLFVSGYTPDAIVHQGVLDPGVHFLEKPFSPAQISAKVAEILSVR